MQPFREDRERDNINVVVIGDPGVGKTSLISTVVSESFTEDVPPVLQPVTVPAELMPEKIPLTISDTSTKHQDFDNTIHAMRNSDVIVLVCSFDLPQSLERVHSYWLMLLSDLGIKVPVVIAINKSDTFYYSTNVSTRPAVASLSFAGPSIDICTERRKIDSLVDNMVVSACVECSAISLNYISDVFYHAQRSVFFPVQPLFNPTTRLLTNGCVKALRHVFNTFARFGWIDETMTDDELHRYQEVIFGRRIKDGGVDGIKQQLRQQQQDFVAAHPWMQEDDHPPTGNAASALLLPVPPRYALVHHNRCTFVGFCSIHQSLIEKRRCDVVWEVLQKCGYNSDLMLSSSASASLTISSSFSASSSPASHAMLKEGADEDFTTSSLTTVDASPSSTGGGPVSSAAPPSPPPSFALLGASASLSPTATTFSPYASFPESEITDFSTLSNAYNISGAGLSFLQRFILESSLCSTRAAAEGGQRGSVRTSWPSTASGPNTRSYSSAAPSASYDASMYHSYTTECILPPDVVHRLLYTFTLEEIVSMWPTELRACLSTTRVKVSPRALHNDCGGYVAGRGQQIDKGEQRRLMRDSQSLHEGLISSATISSSTFVNQDDEDPAEKKVEAAILPDTQEHRQHSLKDPFMEVVDANGWLSRWVLLCRQMPHTYLKCMAVLGYVHMPSRVLRKEVDLYYSQVLHRKKALALLTSPSTQLLPHVQLVALKEKEKAHRKEIDSHLLHAYGLPAFGVHNSIAKVAAGDSFSPAFPASVVTAVRASLEWSPVPLLLSASTPAAAPAPAPVPSVGLQTVLPHSGAAAPAMPGGALNVPSSTPSPVQQFGASGPPSAADVPASSSSPLPADWNRLGFRGKLGPHVVTAMIIGSKGCGKTSFCRQLVNKTYTLSKSALAEAERRSLRRDAGELDGEGQSAGQVRMLMRRMDQFIAQFNSAGRPDGGATCASEDEEEDKEEGRVGRVRGEVSLSPSSYAKNELKKVMPALYCNIVTTSAFASVPTWDPPALSLLHPAEPSGSRPRPMAEALEAAPSAPETASQRQQQQSESPSAQNTRVQALAISSTASPDSSSVSPKVNQSATVPASGPASKLRGTPCTSMDEATLPLSASSSSTSTESLPTVASSTRQEPSFLILKELPSAEGVIDRELEKLGVSNRGETSSHARRQTKNLRFDFKSTRPSPTPSDTSTTAPDMICILYDGASLRSVEFAKKYLIRISENSMSSSSSAKTIACVLIQMKSDVAATAEVVKAIADIRASFEVLHLTFSAYDAFLQRNWRQFASPAMMPQQALVEVQCSRSGEGRFGGCCYCYQCCYSPEVLFKKLFFIGANSSSFVVESFANKARRTFLRRIGYTAAGVAVVAACSFGVSLLFKKHLSPKAQERLTACTEAMLYGVSALIQAGDATLQAIWSHVNFPLW